MKHVLTKADTAKAVQANHDRRNAGRMRREAELCLLDRMLAEAAMPEWYPNEIGGRG